jgi:DNA ligase (NAD+)
MKDAIKNLTALIRQYDHEYYVLKNPSISDQQYNAIFSKLICLEAEHPEYADTNSPTARIGSDITNNFITYDHPAPMLSIKSFYSEAELLAAIPALEVYTIEDKLDGMAIELQYSNGQLFRALSRGNGQQGEDVTDNIRTIKSIPLTIEYALSDITIRGEIIVSSNGFKQVNRLRKSNKCQPFPNQRNAAASLVMSESSAELSQYSPYLEGYFYQILGINSQTETFSSLTKWDFNIPRHTSVVNEYGVQFAVTEFRNNKPTRYPVDGVIIKASSESRKLLGHNSRYVNWAWALKEKSEEIISRFHYIDYSIAKNGTITPVIHFNPVTYKGITYQCAKTDWSTLAILSLTLLCNIHFVVKGSVSAQITGASSTGKPVCLPFFPSPIIPIEKCPCCKHPLTLGNNTRRCENDNCPEKSGFFNYLVADGFRIFKAEHDYGSLALLRFAASTTPVAICRKAKGAANPTVLYQSIQHIADIMQIIGLIGKHN